MGPHVPPADPMHSPFSSFDRCNVQALDFVEIRAHGGQGLIRFARIADRHCISGSCNFIDVAVLPPGTSIGPHRHGELEEEYYLVLEGRGLMQRNHESFPVVAGDLIRNPCRGTHSLVNTGPDDLRIFVFELAIRP